jgi:hypothetical protein
MRRFTWSSVVGLALFLAPSFAHAQASIAGAVRDSSGAVLPGVTVEAASPALIEKVRAVQTDSTGQYRIENLRPGLYTVTFTLAGFNTVRREGIELTGTFTATLNAEMRVGAIEETITVTGETPVVDVQSAARQRVLDRDILEAVPANRFPSHMAALIPGVVNSAVDVGGNLGSPTGGAGNLTVHGSRTTDVAILRNGVSLSTIETGSNTQGIPNMAVAQEVVIDTSIVSAERGQGGVQINMIPREGGNTFSGTFIGSFASSRMQGDNFTQDLRDRGLRTPDSIKRIADANPAFGGPIKRDRLWFFGTALYSSAQNYVAGMFHNRNAGNPTAWTYEPDPARPAFRDTLSKNGAFRLTWQANAKNKLAFAYENLSTCQCSTDVGTTSTAVTAPEAAVLQVYYPNGGWSADWTAPLTNRLLFEAVVYRRFIRSWRAHPEDTPDLIGESIDPAIVVAANAEAVSHSLIGVFDQTSGITYRALRASIARNRSSNWPMRATLSYITGAHSFKVGFMDNAGHKSNFRMDLDAPISYRFNNDAPNQLTLQSTPYDALANLDADIGIYAQDRWTFQRLTLDLGVRYDGYRTSFPEQYAGPGLFVPNRSITFAPTKGLAWHDVTPKMGAAYDLLGNGRTAVKLSLAKYVAGQALRGADRTSVFGDTMNPIDRVVTSTNRSWNDTLFGAGDPRSGNFRPDCDLLNPVANGECGPMSNRNFGLPVPGATYDPEVIGGWGHREYNWQFSAGIQHELMPRVALDATYFRRWYGNFNVTDNRAVTPADYDRFSITAPAHPDLPGRGGYVIDDLYDLTPTKFGVPADNYITFAKHYGKQIEHWNGVDVTINARPRPGVLLMGGLSSGRTTSDMCDIRAQLPETVPVPRSQTPETAPLTPYCRVQTDFLTQVKFLGTYTIPRVDIQVAATYQSLPGSEIVAYHPVPTAVVARTLGRLLSGGNANATVNLVEPGTMYGERRNQFDLRVGKILRAGRSRTTANVDLYNVFNANPVLAENSSFAVWRQPTTILPARFVKLSLLFDF